MAAAFFWLTSRPCERTQISSVNCISSRRYFHVDVLKRPPFRPSSRIFEVESAIVKLISPQDEIESKETKKKKNGCSLLPLFVILRGGRGDRENDETGSPLDRSITLVLKVNDKVSRSTRQPRDSWPSW